MRAATTTTTTTTPTTTTSATTKATPRVVKLSELWRDGWNLRKNHHGEAPEIDFACTEPFVLFTRDTIGALTHCVDSKRHQVQTTARSTFLRGVREMEELIDWRHLREVCSRLAGVELIPHPIRTEWTHVNVQDKPMDRPVDAFHYDYVPFVLVTMLRQDPDEAGGRLVVDGFGPVSLRVGESVLLQGSHVLHQANQAEKGSRITLVTSLAPASVLHTDVTRVRRFALPYGSQEDYFDAACSYRERRVRELCASYPTAHERLLDEFSRWVAQLDGCKDPRFFKPDVVRMFVSNYSNARRLASAHL